MSSLSRSSSSKSNVKTYGSRTSRLRQPLASSTSVPSSDTAVELSSPLKHSGALKRKRSTVPSLLESLVSSPPKKKRTAAKQKENRPVQPSTSSMTQLHLAFGSALKTCKLCGLSYTRGAPQDEQLHKSHCQRVTKGMEWGKDEEKGGEVTVVREGVKLKGGLKGRILQVKADIKGKGRLGTKVATLLSTIDLALSSPAIPTESLGRSKLYIFLVPSTSSTKEKIAGCVVASRIETAMRIVKKSENTGLNNLVCVDGEEGGIFCDPRPLKTPMGIPRMFVASEFRHKGIASSLLTAAAKNFIHGYELDPEKGEVAFSQPTGDGRGVMFAWGGENVRVFEE
ncbi:hypothetical protein FRC03_009059 [Tulasnella sp. 419]|nr:hypothetical protein FRC03_009059 [Tulasnella sp. 419]